MRIAHLPLAVAGVVVALTGCRTVMDPTFMPAGYAYHQEKFKSPPGPPAADIGYPFSVPRNDVVVEKWQAVAASMADRMESELGISPQPVYIEMLPRQNAFNASLDYVLREELRNRGYTLVGAPGNVLNLKPEAWVPGDEKVPVDANRWNDDPQVRVIPVDRSKAHDFIISIIVLKDKMLKGTVKGEYLLPAYGYVRGDGQDRHENKIYKRPGAGNDGTRVIPQSAPDYVGDAPMHESGQHDNAPAPLVPVSQETL
jgi:hypothetical protein